MSSLDFKMIIGVLIGLLCALISMHLMGSALGVWAGVCYLVYILNHK